MSQTWATTPTTNRQRLDERQQAHATVERSSHFGRKHKKVEALMKVQPEKQSLGESRIRRRLSKQLLDSDDIYSSTTVDAAVDEKLVQGKSATVSFSGIKAGGTKSTKKVIEARAVISFVVDNRRWLRYYTQLFATRV